LKAKIQTKDPGAHQQDTGPWAQQIFGKMQKTMNFVSLYQIKTVKMVIKLGMHVLWMHICPKFLLGSTDGLQKQDFPGLAQVSHLTPVGMKRPT
jgi:hypothetical protein